MKTCLKVLPILLRHIYRKEILHFRKLHSVYQQIKFIRILPALSVSHHIFNPDHTVSIESRIALFLELEHKLHLVLTVLPAKVGKEIGRRSVAFIYI